MFGFLKGKQYTQGSNISPIFSTVSEGYKPFRGLEWVGGEGSGGWGGVGRVGWGREGGVRGREGGVRGCEGGVRGCEGGVGLGGWGG